MANAADSAQHLLREAIRDVAFGLALIGGGGFALYWIATTPRGFGGTSGPVGFDTVPIVCSVLLMVLSAVYLAGRILALVAAARVAGRWLPPLRAPLALSWQRLATLLALILYVLALRHVPFWAATFGLLAVMFTVYGQRSPVAVLGIAAAGSAVLTALFIHALRLPI